MRIYDKISDFYNLDQGLINFSEIEFIRNTCKRFGDSILEVGAGTGRVTSELFKMNFNVIAIDLSLPMVKIGKEKFGCLTPNISWIVMDVSKLGLSTKFDIILFLNNVFLELNKPGQMQTILKNIRDFLNPNGAIVIDVFNPLDLNLYMLNGWSRKKGTYELRGFKVDLFVDTSIDFEKKLIYTKLTYKTILDIEEKIITTTLIQRYLFHDEILGIVENCGLQIFQTYGDYNCAVFDKFTSPRQIFILQNNRDL